MTEIYNQALAAVRRADRHPAMWTACERSPEFLLTIVETGYNPLEDCIIFRCILQDPFFPLGKVPARWLPTPDPPPQVVEPEPVVPEPEEPPAPKASTKPPEVNNSPIIPFSPPLGVPQQKPKKE